MVVVVGSNDVVIVDGIGIVVYNILAVVVDNWDEAGTIALDFVPEQGVVGQGGV